MKTSIKIPIRHGDINFIPVNKAEGKVTKNKDRTFIVGYGSTTGHTHNLVVKDLKDLKVTVNEKGERFFTLKNGAVLTHDEHKTITIPKGTYRQFQEEEVNHFAGSVKVKVID